jgi:murein DD-endopeptidase MepM/ murein hydrolase activator NlpD
MKKFYYFSESKLNFVEIKNFNRKFVIVVSTSVLFLTSVLFGGYLVIDNYFNPDNKIAHLKSKNREISKKLSSLLVLYKDLSQSVDSLSDRNEKLRIAANLEPIEDEVKMLGTGGGGDFGELLDLASGSVNMNEMNDYISRVEKQVELEQENYAEISAKLKENEVLFASIPALKPCEGQMTAHGFGMRMHPIYRVLKMHNGIDIVNRTGTPIYAPGAGTVVFVGRRGGFGIAIEIDHGFGYRTIYAHLSKVNVRYKQKVTRGQLIAQVGNTGISTGSHLHYEVHHDGVKLDPANFFFDDFNIFDLTAAVNN